MATKQDQAKANAKVKEQTIGIGSVWGIAMRTAYNTLDTVDATASTAANLARTMEERAINFREEQAISNALRHNTLMAELQEQAQELGITLE